MWRQIGIDFARYVWLSDALASDMRTTLDIEEDVLIAAKSLARRGKKTVGQAISELARKGLACASAPSYPEPEEVLGFRPFPKRGRNVSNELVDKLREAGEY